MFNLNSQIEYHVYKDTDLKLVSFSFEDADKKAKALRRKGNNIRVEAWLIIYKEAE